MFMLKVNFLLTTIMEIYGKGNYFTCRQRVCGSYMAMGLCKVFLHREGNRAQQYGQCSVPDPIDQFSIVKSKGCYKGFNIYLTN